MDFVNVTCEKMLRAVGAMCPSLKEVVFCRETFDSELSYKLGLPVEPDGPLSPDNLESILNEWPKVRVIFVLYYLDYIN